MSDKRLPYFPFYPGDWLSSPTVAGLSLEQQGAYLRLLCYQWQDGPLPTDISTLSNLCGIDREAMAELWQGLGQAFTETEEGLVNERLRKEKNKILNRRERLSEAGKRGANARWDKDENGEAMAGPKGGHREAMATTESDTETDNTEGARVREVLWPVYLDELGGNGRQPSLTDKRRKKIKALDEEHLPDDPDEAAEEFREILKAVQRSEFHMSKRDYQYPDSLFRNEERRDKWADKAANGDGGARGQGMAGNITRGVM